ncbi:patatin-like phospholipase family protein [Wenyingzhuangia aestuarii]|uniref:patatin-like phospholipase family protein n=1 Tax=Wenyingzhuangia aestuarii TaxID=1647582 RepID=UPI00143A4625|nr:patatin-like phospholipase family protein [Wenyingzhuangia aestuarii]NJB81338.1 NTE family protein [Wenyingzhuangia aestuarii]
MTKKIVILFILIHQVVFCQHKENDTLNSPKKVGLVLSGGGAKGFAHIGVLKAIEEAGLQIDYIGGTSMGAAVGALYASGYTAHQVDSIIMAIDFEKMLTDKIDRKYNSFFDKKNNEKYLLTLPIKGFKLGLPIALSKGQNTYNTLSELCHHVDHITNFSELPIPFFCIATNIETGKQVEINSGSLALAVRSSASLPTLLNPSQLDSITVIDGGISNNFPIDLMRTKGVDYVIGVDVQGNLKKQQNLDSALKVIDQIINFQLYGNEYAELDKIDVYLHPKVTDFSIVDFNKKRAIIDAGYKAAKAQLNQLKELARQQNKKPISALKIKPNPKEYTINNYTISGAKNYTRRYIRGKLDFKKNQKINLKKFNQNINYATTSNNFSSIFYNFKENDSIVDLDIKLTENPESRFLKLGIHYDPLYNLSGLVNYTHKHLLLRNDILSVDLAFGDNTRYGINYFIDNGHFLGYGIYSRFNQFETIIKSNNFIGVNQINFEYEDFTNYLYTQGNFQNMYAISVGVEHKHIRSFTNNFASVKDDTRTFFDDSHYLSVLGKIEADTYDKKSFPNQGVLINATWRTFLSSTDFGDNFSPFSQLRVLMEGRWTLSDRLSFFAQGDGALSITHRELDNFNYSLGGYGNNFINNFIPFYGYSFSELEANSFLKTTGSLRYRFYKKNYIDFVANYALIADDVLEFLEHKPFFTNANSGYAIGLSSDTFLGPFDLRYAWSPENKFSSIYFSAGFWF